MTMWMANNYLSVLKSVYLAFTCWNAILKVKPTSKTIIKELLENTIKLLLKKGLYGYAIKTIVKTIKWHRIIQSQ